MSAAIAVTPTGRVQVRTGKVEIGQGLHQALAQIAADALGVSPELVDILPVDTDSSPDQGVTSGSQSVIEAGRAIREACALMGAVPGAARSVGRGLPRRGLAERFAGRPGFIHDLRLPGLLHGRVLHAPQPGAELLRFDDAAARALPGVRGVWRSGALVGLLAETSAQADAAAAALAAGCAWQAAAWPAEEAADLPRLPATPRTVLERGSAAETPHRLQARYLKPWIAHASIAPSCALAQWAADGRLHVWTHSQGVFNLRRDLALAFALPEAEVRVQHAEGAGCYGHNGADDVAFDAAWLAREVKGTPVRVLWRRADELSHAPFGPAMAVELHAGFDEQGRVQHWQHEVWSPGHSRRPGRSTTPALLGAWEMAGGFAPPASIDMPWATGGGAERNAVPGYDIPAVQVRVHSVKTVRRSSALRALGAFANVFAAESFVDEIAHHRGRCPLALRREHLAHDARALAVLDAAAAAAGWAQRQKADGTGHGIGCARYKGTGAWCAVVAEVHAAATLQVRRLWIAVDVGQPVNPDGVVQQIEGGAIQATSWTLKEAAAPAHDGWADYPLLRFSEVPQVAVQVMPSSEPSLGAGEASLGPTAAAIANALFDALGVRVRELPLTPERIVAAMPA